MAPRQSRRIRKLAALDTSSTLNQVPQSNLNQLPPSTTYHSNSDSSDDDTFSMSSLSLSSSHLNMATVKFHDAHKTAPILTKGNVSPAVLSQLLQYFNSYFHKCKIDNEDKVRNVLMSFEDIKIDNWIKNNQETFLADGYTFEAFTAELRKRFLDPHWESTIVRTIVNSQMTPHESFSTFANRVMQGNNLLIGTTSHLDSTALRSKLELNMSTYLADKLARLRPADKERIAAITIFECWIRPIRHLVEAIRTL